MTTYKQINKSDTVPGDNTCLEHGSPLSFLRFHISLFPISTFPVPLFRPTRSFPVPITFWITSTPQACSRSSRGASFLLETSPVTALFDFREKRTPNGKLCAIIDIALRAPQTELNHVTKLGGGRSVYEMEESRRVATVVVLQLSSDVAELIKVLTVFKVSSVYYNTTECH